MNTEYQPEKWIVLKDDVYAIQAALNTAMMHMQDRLTTARCMAENVKCPSMATRVWIKKLEDDTQLLFEALKKIQAMPISTT